MVAGAAICFFSVGAGVNFGIGLIIEGATDIYKGVAGLIKGKFDFSAYIKEKGVSLLVTAAFAGPAALKETLELTKNGISFISKEGFKEAYKQFA